MKSAFVVLLILLLLVSLGGCREDTPTPEIQATTPVYADGLSPDKTFYQLTDKDGVVIRIPLGKPVKNGTSYSSPSAADGQRGGESSNDGIYVFSELSLISFGYGEVKHPVSRETICIGDGNPYSVPEEYILILQCTDQNNSTVAPDSPEAYYLYIFALDYKTQPGTFLFRDTVQILCPENQILLYDHRETEDPTVLITDHMIWSYYDEWNSQWVTVYSIVESKEVDTPGVTYTLTLKQSTCTSDWTVLNWTETTYDDQFRVETEKVYEKDGILRLLQHFDDEGTACLIEEYDENGTLFTRNTREGNMEFSESYDPAGNLTGRSTITHTGENSWTNQAENLLENTYSEQVFTNGIIEKETFYPKGPAELYSIRYFNAEGILSREEHYAADGTLLHWEEWINGEIVNQGP